MPGSTTNQLYISQWQVKIDGAVIPEPMSDAILSVEVDRAVFLPGMATIELHDPDLKWADDAKFGIGKPIIIMVTGTQVGAAATELFNGEITAVEANIHSDGASTLVVRAYDKSHRLQRNRKARVFLQQKDSDAITSVNGQSGSGMTAQVDATTEVRDHIFQDNLTDFDFICRLARRNGMVVLPAGTNLQVKKPASFSTEINLTYRENLHEFRTALISTGQTSKVTVRGWDPKTKAAVVGQSQSTDSGAAKTGWGSTGAGLSQSGFAATEVLVSDVPIAKQADGDAIAKSTLGDRWSRDISGEGIAEGDPGIVPGTWLVLQKIGTRFGGKYFATRVRHIYTARAYETHFWTSGLEPETAADLILGAGQGSDGLGAGGGVAIGVVTNLEDPDNMGRVKLKFPWMDDKLETWWARMASPMAGANRGIQFMPEVNDEVLVAFDRGDRGQPYVIGALWNGKDAPPLRPAEFNKSGSIVKQQIKTRTGHIIEFSETQGSEHISVLTAKGHKVNLDDGGKKVLIQSTGGHKVEIDDNGTGKITIKSGGDVMVEAGGKVTVKATMDASIEGMNVSVKATGKLELSGATVKVNGSGMLDLVSAGITSVKGSLVKIN